MSARGAIPTIIRDILDKDTGYVLLITGDPGTGKSLLVQEILRIYDSALMVLTNNEDITPTNGLVEQIPDWENRHFLVHYWRELAEDVGARKNE